MATPVSRQTRATIIDVARAAGVSRQTVSNALNNPERLAPETLERVLREVERVGFTPNAQAQQLRRRRSSAFGFEVNASGGARMGHVLDTFLVELTAAAPQHESHLVTFAQDPKDVLGGYRHLLGTGLVDGFILTNTYPGDPRPQWLLDHSVPFVAFGRLWDYSELTQWVDTDGRSGTRAAVAHLVERGYRQIAFLGWPAGTTAVGDDRRQGWRDGLEAAGLAGVPIIEESGQDLEEAMAAGERLITRLDAGSAVVCVTDLIALGVMRAARNAGLEPGRDLGVVGFDDSDVAEALHLTSVRQPLQQAARAAWRLLLGTSGTPSRDPAGTSAGEPREPALLVPELIIRSTTTRARLTPGQRIDHTPEESQ